MNGTLPILSLAELKLRLHFTLPVIKGSIGVQHQVSFILAHLPASFTISPNQQESTQAGLFFIAIINA